MWGGRSAYRLLHDAFQVPSCPTVILQSKTKKTKRNIKHPCLYNCNLCCILFKISVKWLPRVFKLVSDTRSKHSQTCDRQRLTSLLMLNGRSFVLRDADCVPPAATFPGPNLLMDVTLQIPNQSTLVLCLTRDATCLQATRVGMKDRRSQETSDEQK